MRTIVRLLILVLCLLPCTTAHCQTASVAGVVGGPGWVDGWMAATGRYEAPLRLQGGKPVAITAICLEDVPEGNASIPTELWNVRIELLQLVGTGMRASWKYVAGDTGRFALVTFVPKKTGAYLCVIYNLSGAPRWLVARTN